MDGHDSPVTVAGIMRLFAVAAVGVAALVMLVRALSSGSLGLALVAAALFAGFVALTRASIAKARRVGLAVVPDGPGAARATVDHPYEPTDPDELPYGGPAGNAAPQPAETDSDSRSAAYARVEEESVRSEASEAPVAEEDHVAAWEAAASIPVATGEPAETRQHGGDVPSQEQPRPEAPATASDVVVPMPVSLDPDVVAMALLDAVAPVGQALGVHLWLEDPASGTLRQVSAVGTAVPDEHPLPLDDDPLGLAVETGAARMTPVTVPTWIPDATTVWRFAVPLQTRGARGVMGIDFASATPPDVERLVEITATLRPAVTGSLALHVAKTQTETARTLVEVAHDLSRRLDPDQVLNATLLRAMRLSDAATGSIMLLEEETGEMSIAAAEGIDEEVVSSTRVKAGEGIAGWVLETRQPLLIEDLPGRDGSVRRHDVRSAISVPIADEDGLLGVLSVASRTYPARFTDEHMEALNLLGTQTAVALRNARAVVSARELYFATLRALVLALESRDPATHGDTDRVVEVAVSLGNALSLPEPDMQALEIAALLHDIGMKTSAQFATSARPLSTFERGLLKMHPALAAEILQEVPALTSVIPIVYHHHEWYDGSGYVLGLAGDAIPLASRILAVADAFVAMTSARPYRPALSETEALDELLAKAGTQFDPEVVRTFLEMMKRRPEPTLHEEQTREEER